MADIDRTARAELVGTMATTFLRLIDAAQDGSIPVGDFASAIEHEWNFGEERGTLSERDRTAVKELFDVAVYYSPYAEELARIANYRDEQDVLRAAKACRKILAADVR